MKINTLIEAYKKMRQQYRDNIFYTESQINKDLVYVIYLLPTFPVIDLFTTEVESFAKLESIVNLFVKGDHNYYMSRISIHNNYIDNLISAIKSTKKQEKFTQYLKTKEFVPFTPQIHVVKQNKTISIFYQTTGLYPDVEPSIEIYYEDINKFLDTLKKARSKRIHDKMTK